MMSDEQIFEREMKMRAKTIALESALKRHKDEPGVTPAMIVRTAGTFESYLTRRT